MIARLALLVLTALAMWGGVPLLWLYLGSLVQSATDSAPAAAVVMVAGAVLTIVGLVVAMGAITRGYQRARVARGLEDTGNFPLEVTLVCTAFAAGAALLAGYVVGLTG